MTTELLSFQRFPGDSGLSESFVELVRLDVSRRNQCPRAMEMHALRARELGESPERLAALPVWRSVTLHSRKECAALAWADCVLRATPRVLDDEYLAARESFEQAELVDLTVVIVACNAWSQLMVSFGTDQR
jgi:AhpD family alkylhydroperoxidase